LPSKPALVQRKTKDARGQRYTNDWRKVRKYVLLANPFCQCGELATEVHHKDDNRKNNRPENLTAICRKCHNRLTHSH
jgi:5-methylcytosine-specific restriction endonuclease McrA